MFSLCLDCVTVQAKKSDGHLSYLRWTSIPSRGTEIPLAVSCLCYEPGGSKVSLLSPVTSSGYQEKPYPVSKILGSDLMIAGECEAIEYIVHLIIGPRGSS